MTKEIARDLSTLKKGELVLVEISSGRVDVGVIEQKRPRSEKYDILVPMPEYGDTIGLTDVGKTASKTIEVNKIRGVINGKPS